MKIRVLLLIFLLAFGAGCAGPSTPLGAIRNTSTVESYYKHGLPKQLDPEMYKSPKTNIQIEKYETSSNQKCIFKITITPKDTYKLKSNYKIAIRYNEHDITQNFLKTAKVDFTPEHLEIRSAPVSLPGTEPYLIEVVFGSSQTEWDTLAQWNQNGLGRGIASSEEKK